MRRALLVLLAGLLCLGGLGLKYGHTVRYDLTRAEVKRGSADEEFSPREKRARASARDRRLTPWPTYGFDVARSKSGAGFAHRPPYRELWSLDARDSLEFPPSVGYGKVFLAQQKGLFFALDAPTGKVAWRKSFGRCSASSPTLANGVVYQSWMGDIPCKQSRKDQDGFLVAWRARDGKELWRFHARPIESSPLYRRGVVYVASWDHQLYALDARTGQGPLALRGRRPAELDPRVLQGSHLHRDQRGVALRRRRCDRRARPGARSRTATSATATSSMPARRSPTAGSTSATSTARFTPTGRTTGRLLWQRPLGTYIYGSAAVHAGRVFIGTYDGNLFALEAATGDVVWRHASPAAVHSSPVVLNGLVYYASCSSCGQFARRKVKHGHDGTYALDVRNGREVWRFRAGKYASPVVADRERVYMVGRAKLFALTGR